MLHSNNKWVDRIQRVLIARGDVLGDVVLITPLLTALKTRWPHLQITVMLQPYTQPLLKHHPHVDAILLDPEATGEIQSWKGLWSYAKKLRTYQFDLFIALWEKPIYSYLSWLARIPYRIGEKNRYWPGLLYNKGVKRNYRDFTQHQVELNEALLTPLGIPITEIPVQVKVPEVTELPSLLQEHPKYEKTSTAKIAISLGSSGGKRFLSPQALSQALGTLIPKINPLFILLGPEREIPTANAICEQYSQHTVNLVNQTNLPTLMAVIEKSDLHVGADGGPAHIAAGLGTPTLTVFTVKHPKPARWAPWTHRGLTWRKPLACPLVCVPERCQETYCTDNMIAAEIAEKIEATLSHSFPTSIAQAKQDWIRQSLNILIYYSDSKEGAKAKTIFSSCQKEGLNVSLYHPLQKNPVAIIKEMVAAMIEQETNIIYLLGKQNLWIWLAKMIASNFVTAVPLVIRHQRSTPKLSWLTYFIQQCQQHH